MSSWNGFLWLCGWAPGCCGWALICGGFLNRCFGDYRGCLGQVWGFYFDRCLAYIATPLHSTPLHLLAANIILQRDQSGQVLGHRRCRIFIRSRCVVWAWREPRACLDRHAISASGNRRSVVGEQTPTQSPQDLLPRISRDTPTVARKLPHHPSGKAPAATADEHAFKEQ